MVDLQVLLCWQLLSSRLREEMGVEEKISFHYCSNSAFSLFSAVLFENHFTLFHIPLSETFKFYVV